MKTQILMASMVAGLVLVAGNANARGGPDFATLDANGDGQLTVEELQGAAQTQFEATDTDGDGALSLAELTARSAENAASRAEKMLSRLDANEDGSLTPDEMRAPRPERAARMFERADADGDGVLSEEEFEAVKSRRGDGRGKGHGRDRDRG